MSAAGVRAYPNRGQALVEYLACAAAIATALFAPVFDGTSAAEWLLEAIARAYRNGAFLISLS